MPWWSLVVFVVSPIFINRKMGMFGMIAFTISQTRWGGWQRFFECRHGSAGIVLWSWIVLRLDSHINWCYEKCVGSSESMKHVIESFIYVFSAYHVFKFYYSSSSFTMLCIYVITSCLVFPLFACSIKFLRGSHLLHDSSLYIYLPVCVMIPRCIFIYLFA